MTHHVEYGKDTAIGVGDASYKSTSMKRIAIRNHPAPATSIPLISIHPPIYFPAIRTPPRRVENRVT
ncbi:hypothetical protein K2D_40780 [Planctomycetes bacterium K2D]|uniref:Uncharacterized protein n=1 Tax=Botrimarina mediterranea TaxID=2528022 RepID=A0A518KDH7_9BACT|nr:hypothetical protein Spa11_40750 [Botrimarina mediterranea]QDV80449.1 hypothetical protein K2D_40780 [Planctomycetes bacterium K2D]